MNRQQLLSLFFVIISIILYCSSEYGINRTIIILNFVVFISCCLLLELKNLRKLKIYSFNTIFLGSFFLTSYCFPLFIASSSLLEDYITMAPSSIRHVDFNYITIGNSLCTLAISIYTFGQLFRRNKTNRINRGFPLYSDIKRATRFLLCLFFIASLINMFISISAGGIVYFDERAYLYEYYRLFLALSLVSHLFYNDEWKMSRSLFFRKYKIEILTSFILIVVFLVYGERGEPISIFLIIFSFAVIYCLRVSFVKLAIVAFIGLLLMYGIRITRKDSNSLQEGGVSSFASATSSSLSEDSPLFLFADLIAASNELCYGLELHKRDGLLHPEQIILLPFYPFPFAPTIASEVLLGVEWSELSAVEKMNNEMKAVNYYSCFGNHIVVDIFMKWGLLGIFIAFFILGNITCYFEKNSKRDIITATCFILLIGNAMYLPRGTMFSIVRMLTDVYIFAILINACSRKRVVVLPK